MAKAYPDTFETPPRKERPIAGLTIAIVTYEHIPLYAGTQTIGQMVDAHLAHAEEEGKPVFSLKIDFPQDQ